MLRHRGSELALESRYRLGSLESGTLLCRAYEAYRQLHSPAEIGSDSSAGMPAPC